MTPTTEGLEPEVPSDGAPANASEPGAPAWTRSAEAAAEDLGVDPQRGLDKSEVKQRRQRHGSNRLREARRESVWRILARQFASLIVLLLVGAGTASVVFGQLKEAIAIFAVVVINAAIGFTTELKAVRSMEALRQLGRVRARVRRDGSVDEIAAAEMVPGDVVLLEAGDLVPADLRLIESSKLQADESALTGESTPVSKGTEAVDADTSLAERRCMLFRGTSVTRGSAAGVAVATGMDTQIGQIAEMVEQAEPEQTPLERRLDQLGTRLVWITLGIAAAVTLSGALAGKDLWLMVETGIALAVATVPEGLPIVATIALARGMWRMARRKALINRLSAVETLGATTVICSDKTGTLTENRMTVTRLLLSAGVVKIGGEDEEDDRFLLDDDDPVDPAENSLLRTALEIAVLCNNAELDGDESSGEPMELALLVAGRKAGIARREILEDLPEKREEPFASESKKMATFHEDEGQFRVAVKGAPEAVLEVSSRILTEDGEQDLDDETRRQWQELNETTAGEGLRVLALAQKTAGDREADPYEDLVFVGLVGLLDPPRSEVKEAIERCSGAGIRAVMVTGDQKGTAINVGHALGMMGEDDDSALTGDDLGAADELGQEQRKRITQTKVFARVSPKQKLRLIALHQEDGAIVAMTGDGVNDAPALKKADIGVAMGQRGTQVAAQAADMVLRDDSFKSIVAAVEQGRVIFDNIRNFVYYLLSCNLSEVLVVAVASLMRLPLPIEPLQILFLNLVTDVFPALALGVGEGDPRVMRRPPRDPQEPILTRRHWLGIGGYGLLITLCVFAAFLLMLRTAGAGEREAVTISFLTLASAQLWHVFNMRGSQSGFIDNDIVGNVWVWGALALCVGLLGLAVFFAPLADLLNVVRPDGRGWMIVAGFSLLPLVVGQTAIRLGKLKGGTGKEAA